MAKQGYSDRMDESLGMRRGKESSKKQSYKSRRDESRGMKDDMGTMGHASKVYKCDPFAAQRADMNRIKNIPFEKRGYPSQAWDYDY